MNRVDRLSVVAPCYNEEAVLPEFLRRISAAAADTGLEYEIVLVDDGSSDTTWRLISEAASKDGRIVGVRLLRNHGHQLALSAGLSHARGSLVLAIDADLQDPPELVGPMIETMKREQAIVVYGQRGRRAGETRFKVVTAFTFYRTLNWLSKTEIPRDTGDFRLMTREVVDVLNAMPERHRFLRGMVAWIGGRQVPYRYDRDSRFAGETKYPLRRMLNLAVDATTSFSRRPLLIATYMGLLMMLAAFMLAMWATVSYFMFETQQGWASLMAVISLLFALQFLILGIIGEYVGRLFETSQGRPLFMVANVVGTGLEGQGAEGSASEGAN